MEWKRFHKRLRTIAAPIKQGQSGFVWMRGGSAGKSPDEGEQRRG
ncbi:hypothetical protein PAMC26510_26790 [Caballeronia sordidicola]|uniref:Uncharacterized protein n=1 Tax=Caballeronia sordidicola TaxID=196367 RepID=A0A242MEL3_CABSO|nr:hypothetical protein PAMC26510_26790 [Caballeronia sordidicola]